MRETETVKNNMTTKPDTVPPPLEKLGRLLSISLLLNA